MMYDLVLDRADGPGDGGGVYLGSDRWTHRSINVWRNSQG